MFDGPGCLCRLAPVGRFRFGRCTESKGRNGHISDASVGTLINNSQVSDDIKFTSAFKNKCWNSSSKSMKKNVKRSGMSASHI